MDKTTIQEALIWAVKNDKLQLAISGPQIRVYGDVLPNGYSYALDDNEEYAGDVMLGALAGASWRGDAVEGLFRDLVDQHRKALGKSAPAPTTTTLPGFRTVHMSVGYGAESLGRVTFYPGHNAERQYKAERLCPYSLQYRVVGGGGYFGDLHSATAAVIQAA